MSAVAARPDNGSQWLADEVTGVPAVADDQAAVADALNALWQAIRRHHRNVPKATVTVVPGAQPGCSQASWGPADQRVVTVAASTLARGPQQVLQVVLHQAAHLLTGLPVASEGRYHGKDFRDAAQGIGLVTGARRRGLGWPDPRLGPYTERVYSAQLEALAAAAGQPVPPAVFGRNGVSAVCQCKPPRTIRIRGTEAAVDLVARPVRCEACGGLFAIKGN